MNIFWMCLVVLSISPSPSEFPQAFTCAFASCQKDVIFNSCIPFLTTFVAEFYVRNYDSFSTAIVDLLDLSLNTELH